MSDAAREGGRVDPVTTSELGFVLSRLADGALGEAGKQAWDALAGLLRRFRRREPDPAAIWDTREARPSDQNDVHDLVASLVRFAAADPEFAALLREWLASTGRIVPVSGKGNVSNTVTGPVHGPSVQVRDITGPVSFGSGSSGQ